VYRRLLCPIDYTDTSREVLGRAVALARLHGATLTVLHVCPPHVIALTELPAERAMAEARRRLSRAILAAGAHLDGYDGSDIEVRAIVLIGDPARCIVESAAANAIDLIVMGAHERHGLERLVLGSVAAAVVKRARCQVLTIPDRAVDQPPGSGLAVPPAAIQPTDRLTDTERT
jgi:nucleotide-binding universal stress UspA family protein